MYQTLIKPFLQDAKKYFLDTFFPIRCLVCNKEGQYICGNCAGGLKRLEQQRCIVCEKPSVGGMTHLYCQTPFGADGLISVFDYHDENVKNIIIKGKYSFVPDIYRILGAMIANEIKSNSQLLSSKFYLVPIPLSPSRRRWRGFNQAEILCQTMSKELGLPVADILKRKKITKVQKDVKKKEDRAKNMSDAFALLSSISFDIHGHNFIFIDDVVTTGSTLSEAVKVLKRNGASKVFCLTIARD